MRQAFLRENGVDLETGWMLYGQREELTIPTHPGGEGAWEERDTITEVGSSRLGDRR